MAIEKKIIATKNAPGAIGPYSQGIVATGTNLMFVSGQIPLDPATGSVPGSDIAVQARQSLNNLKAVLEAAGAGLENVVKTTVFLTDLSEFAAMNEIYAEFFPENPPARSAVQVVRLPKDVKIEIEAIAFV